MKSLLFVMGLLTVLGCAASPAEEEIARLEEVEERVEAKLRRLDGLGVGPVTISCSELAFQKVVFEGGAGHLLIACESSVRSGRAYEVTFLLGNPYEVEYKNILLECGWDAYRARGVLGLRLGDRATAEFSGGPLMPGQWKRVRHLFPSEAPRLDEIRLAIRVPPRRLSIPAGTAE